MSISKFLNCFRQRRSPQTRQYSVSSKTRRSVHLLCEELEGRIVPAGTLRVVTYNMEADINGVTTPRSGFYQVLEGIGEEQVQGHFQPLDILLLQETTSNSTTVAPIVNNLNSYYTGAAVYAQSTYQATESGNDPTSGNGPNALVYNTTTLKLLASVGVGTPGGSSNGEYRQVVRYEFQPVGDTGSTGIFYVYVSHMKSGTTSADATARGAEATIIRNDEATLPASASVLYTGDLNSAPPEAEFTNFTASGQGQAFDPLNFSSSVQYWSDSSTNLRYRDDYELMTSNVLNDTAAINYVSGTLHTFGNNGTTPSGGSVNSGSDTALNSDLIQDVGAFISASTLYADLTTASDHLPVFADYTLPAQSTTTTLTASSNPSTLGQSVTFTATISPVVPTGETVTFKDGTTTLGTSTTTASGATSFSTSSLTVGSHSITAVYAGDSNFTTSTSTPVSQVVNQATTTTTLSSLTNPSVFGQSVTFIAVANGGFTPTPTGTITFKDGSTTLGTGTLNANGGTSFTISTLSGGTHVITAVYGGDTGHSGSTSANVNQVVNAANTTTTVVSSLNPSTFGQAVTFTATVAAVSPGAGIPTGTVSFLDGSTPLGSGTLNGSGVATFATSSLSVGTHSITAVYPASTNYNTSTSGTVSQVVNAGTFQITATTVLGGDNGFLLTSNAPYKLNTGSTGFNLYTGDIGGTLNPNRAVQITGPGGARFGVPGMSDTLRFNAIPVSSTQLELILTGINHTALPTLLASGSWNITVLGGSSNPGIVQLSNGNALDGNDDGNVQATDNYTSSVTATAPAATTAIITMGDVVAGPGQTITAPLVVSGNVSDVTSVDFQFPLNNPDFTVTGVTFTTAISGASGQFNAATGLGVFGGPTPFAANDSSPVLIGTVSFQIPGLGNAGTAPALGAKVPIGFTVTGVTDHALNPKPFTIVDGFQVSAYLGDVSPAFGVYSGTDVSGIQVLIVGLVTAFSEYKDLDPHLLADVNRDGNVTGADVSNLQSRIVGGTSSLPALPANANTVTVGPDPRVFLDASALGSIAPGQTNVQVPIKITNTNGTPITINTANFAVQFDPSVLSFQGVALGAVSNGSDTQSLAAWTYQANVVNGNALLITGSTTVGPQLAVGQTGVIFYLDFNVAANAAHGLTTLNMLNDHNFTALSNNQLTALTLSPAVSDRVQWRANGGEDDQLNVQGSTPNLDDAFETAFDNDFLQRIDNPFSATNAGYWVNQVANNAKSEVVYWLDLLPTQIWASRAKGMSGSVEYRADGVEELYGFAPALTYRDTCALAATPFV